MIGHTDRETINARRPLSQGMRDLLAEMARPGGALVYSNTADTSRARALYDRGYAEHLGTEKQGQRWGATTSGRKVLDQ